MRKLFPQCFTIRASGHQMPWRNAVMTWTKKVMVIKNIHDVAAKPSISIEDVQVMCCALTCAWLRGRHCRCLAPSAPSTKLPGFVMAAIHGDFNRKKQVKATTGQNSHFLIILETLWSTEFLEELQDIYHMFRLGVCLCACFTMVSVSSEIKSASYRSLQ